MTQARKAGTFVLVHGAWSGGWCYAKVADRLRARGHRVFTPTLTGQGERSHLLAGTLNLSTHVTDVLNVFRYEGLRDVVLAGHSYGGMVVTGVGDRIAEKISALVYLRPGTPSMRRSPSRIGAPPDCWAVKRPSPSCWISSNRNPCWLRWERAAFTAIWDLCCWG